MKATLKYEMPDDWEEFGCAVHAVELREAVGDFADYLRQLRKMDITFDTPDETIRVITAEFFSRCGEFIT